MAELVHKELWLQASARAVWDAVTAHGWLADEVELELRPGGEASFRSGDGERRGWVEEASPPAAEGREGRLAFWWARDGEPATRVELTIDELSAGTRLQVVEARPLDALDLVGLPLPGRGGREYGPALLAA
jgi:hypothetical protein